MRKVDLLRGKIQKLVNLLTQRKIKVAQHGSEASTEYNAESGEPVAINIPQIPDNADDALLAAVEGYIDHEVGHVLFTDFNCLKSASKNQKMAQLFNMVEDSYIERMVAGRFTGSTYNLAKVAEVFEKENIDPVVNDCSVSQEDLNKALLLPAIRAWAGNSQYVFYMKDKWCLIQDMVKRIGDCAKRELPNINSSQESFRVAETLLALLDYESPPKQQQQQRKNQSQDRGQRGQSDGQGKPDQKNGGKQNDEGQDQNDQGDDELQSGKEKGIQWFDKSNGSDVYFSKLNNSLKKMIDELESDAGYRVYTTDFDIIEPVMRHRRIGQNNVTNLENSVRNVVGVVQKKLERAIAAKSLGYWVGGHRSGRLNASALSRFIIKNDDRLFKRKHISNTKDTAVSLLIDCSGSMGGKRINLASQAAYALISALERMNIKNEVLGFTTGGLIKDVPELRGVGYDFDNSRGRRLVTYVFKPFNERFVYEHKMRLTVSAHSAIDMRDNVDGESVMIATNRLLARGETRKILMVLSDGRPNSYGFVDFAKHLRDTVSYIEKDTPIDIIGIGILSDEVRKYYSKHVILNELEKLPTTCLDELQKILLK